MTRILDPAQTMLTIDLATGGQRLTIWWSRRVPAKRLRADLIQIGRLRGVKQIRPLSLDGMPIPAELKQR